MVDKKTVEYVAELARIKVDPEQKEYLAGQLSKILEYIDKLKQVNTDNVEPMREVNQHRNVLRKDEAVSFSGQQDILNNAPSRFETYFKIPKVIE
ncbi:MAG: Asp-tRNA(Asn)/Glu-tRNA(Gln) amidotransferase subunit GatC [Candidatus Omnitrophica bacterium]|nr:Asp-tRNA(Asn)/Glu-tRNA(Gln) amidotransferase subunit GatC [Candidatus Omnitrophota bacterium]